ncbi:hypothetical protein ACJMK2_022170 [Sinanodonta woodiana]|uniref:Uncharacterized protein n=1 Tax=Sinanodonta woodiana TaxID=1069815 RepID=A0ABD3TJX8_SINWO
MADNRIAPSEFQDLNGDQGNTKNLWVAATRFKTPNVPKRPEAKPIEQPNKIEWIQQNIKIKKCLSYAQSEEENICHCGKDKDKHKNNEDKEQNKNDFEPTNAFGEIHFDDARKSKAKFVRVDSKATTTSTILELMKNIWTLEMPNLLISVTGSENNFVESSLRDSCQNSLRMAVQGTGAWLITNGRQDDVTKLVGKAVSTDEQRIVTIGITPWRTIDKKHKLVNEKGSHQAQYPHHESSLDPNHSYFILMDDGHQDGSNNEMNFREELKGAIDEIKRKTGVSCVPLVLLVLEWDEKISETVKNAIKINIPVVIVKNPRIYFRISNTDTSKNNRSDTTSSLLYSKEIPKEDKLIHICEWNSESGDFDIGLAILKALSKATKNKAWDSMTNAMYQLKLAFAWNRIDIAKKISKETIQQMVQGLDDFMMNAILMDRTEFVELLLQNGFDLKKFLTQEKLGQLYHKTISLEDVKKLLQYLYGDSGLKFTRYVNRGKIDTNHPTEGTQAEGSEPTKPEDDDPCLDLLILSVLHNRHDMAKVFWRHGEDAMASALFADAILYAMSHHIDDKVFKENCEKQKREFTNLAIGVLKECHKDDVDKTKDLLVQQSQWGETSCVLIAVNAKNKQFMSEHACQDVFNNIWMGNLDEDNGSLLGNLKLLLCILFPPLILSWISCKDDEQAQITPSSEQMDPNSKPPPTREATVTSNNIKPIPATDYRRSKCHTIKSFYLAPVIIFFHNVISYIIFLGLYSYILICKFDRYLAWQEIVLCVWVFTIFTEEVIQVCTTPPKDWSSRLSNYIRDGWNILDIITVFMFLFGMILRIFDHAQVAEAAHIVLGVNMITFYLRLLHIFSVHRELGPKLVMIMHMVYNLAYFIMILLVFIVAYGIASYAILYPHTEPSLATLTDIFRRPYWNIYGELMLEKIEGSADCTNDPALYNSGSYSRCPTESGKYFVPLLMGVYMLMSNILLLNLLIAMFRYT